MSKKNTESLDDSFEGIKGIKGQLIDGRFVKELPFLPEEDLIIENSKFAAKENAASKAEKEKDAEKQQEKKKRLRSIYDAVAENDLVKLKKLINENEKSSDFKNIINWTNDDRWAPYTPLMIAAINNKTDLLNELLNAPGIKIDKKSGDGKTAVFLAEENKSNAAVTELLKNNANIDIKPTNLRRYKDTNISMDDRDEYETDAIAESTIIDNLRSKKNQISQRRSTNGGKKSRRRKTKRSKKTRRSRR